MVKKVCKCRCGKGYLRPDLAYIGRRAAAAAVKAAEAASATTGAAGPAVSARGGSARRSRGGKGKGRASAASTGRGSMSPTPCQHPHHHHHHHHSHHHHSHQQGAGSAAVAARPRPSAVGTGSAGNTPPGSWIHHAHGTPSPAHDTLQRKGSLTESGGGSPLWGNAPRLSASAFAATVPRAVLPFSDLAPGLAPDWTSAAAAGGDAGSAATDYDGGDGGGGGYNNAQMRGTTDLRDTSWLEEERAPPNRRWSTPQLDAFDANGAGSTGRPADDSMSVLRMQSAELPWATSPPVAQHQQHHQHGGFGAELVAGTPWNTGEPEWSNLSSAWPAGVV